MYTFDFCAPLVSAFNPRTRTYTMDSMDTTTTTPSAGVTVTTPVGTVTDAGCIAVGTGVVTAATTAAPVREHAVIKVRPVMVPLCNRGHECECTPKCTRAHVDDAALPDPLQPKFRFYDARELCQWCGEAVTPNTHDFTRDAVDSIWAQCLHRLISCAPGDDPSVPTCRYTTHACAQLLLGVVAGTRKRTNETPKYPGAHVVGDDYAVYRDPPFACVDTGAHNCGVASSRSRVLVDLCVWLSDLVRYLTDGMNQCKCELVDDWGHPRARGGIISTRKQCMHRQASPFGMLRCNATYAMTHPPQLPALLYTQDTAFEFVAILYAIINGVIGANTPAITLIRTRTDKCVYEFVYKRMANDAVYIDDELLMESAAQVIRRVCELVAAAKQ